jgi:hypothetical protein
MKKHGSVQIEGMGESISLVAKFSQILSKDGYAIVENIVGSNAGEGRSLNPKLAIKLNKSSKFD